MQVVGVVGHIKIEAERDALVKTNLDIIGEQAYEFYDDAQSLDEQMRRVAANPILTPPTTWRKGSRQSATWLHMYETGRT